MRASGFVDRSFCRACQVFVAAFCQSTSCLVKIVWSASPIIISIASIFSLFFYIPGYGHAITTVFVGNGLCILGVVLLLLLTVLRMCY